MAAGKGYEHMKAKKMMPLDNAAKIYPAAMTKK